MQIPAGKEITRYFYEGNRVVLESDASGTITTHNTYSINLASRRAGEEGYYYLYNAHGDVVTLVGMQDHREVRYRYDAFGTLLEVTGDADNSITYAGYQYDSESGLYYLNARYYDSTTARFLTEDTYAGQANDPLSLHRYTYCANNPLRYTDPDGHFWGAVLRFVAGAVVGAVTEFVTQKFIEKRDKIDVKAILYEGVVGGVTSVIGGVGGAAKKAGKTAKTAKAVVKTTAKAGAKEATLAFAEDLGRQVFVDGKSLKEVDYGQSLEAGASAGVTAVIDELDSVLGTKKQLSTTNRKKASQATGVIDDAADAAPRKRANVLPDAEGMPNRGAVKNSAGGLADAVEDSTSRKNASTGKGKSSKRKKAHNTSENSSQGLSKNQQKMQNQTVESKLSGNTKRKNKKHKSSNNVNPLTENISQATSQGKKNYSSEKTITNSAGQDVVRKYVKDQDELLKVAEEAAGGDLDSFTPRKEYYYRNKDNTLEIEWNPDGHEDTDEGPHVKISSTDSNKKFHVIEKYFIENWDHYRYKQYNPNSK